jgi:hypothetical protein
MCRIAGERHSMYFALPAELGPGIDFTSKAYERSGGLLNSIEYGGLSTPVDAARSTALQRGARNGVDLPMNGFRRDGLYADTSLHETPSDRGFCCTN